MSIVPTSHSRHVASDPVAQAWMACRCAMTSPAAGSMVAVAGVPPVWQAMYQLAYERAQRTVRIQRPGRYVPPSMN